MNRDHLKKKYKDMVQKISEIERGYGTVNEYVCEEGHKTVTKDLDNGGTPFMFHCPSCCKIARSRMYRGSQSPEVVHFEWYLPLFKGSAQVEQEKRLP